MNNFELERNFRRSNEIYPLKATRYIYGISQMPCPNCPYKNEYPPISIFKKTEDCFKKCSFKICLWILSKEQLEIYERVRPPEKKKEDVELAIQVGEIVAIEKTLRV